ncbi:homoserine kinase [Veillonella denticariosi JCM 15641]|uniref:Homoserine kinase n=1 Tax=Veillonella denticariosi JCM 15641 TaxID=1298594 RepID=A0A2S7Z8L2_9FIRM|nr:homoserine kinase [Veillonella denticariosi]PQL19535.1 homoserine kinase [Veillonella denticariosi JCM 15641]
METIRVQVPATSANCGPGFDCLGLALNLYNIFTFRPLEDATEYTYTFEGFGADILRMEDPKKNLIGFAMDQVFATVQEPIRYGHITSETLIPPSRGLGSSSTAIVGGLLLANTLVKNPLTKEELLVIANRMEGHPDNVAPAIYGNLCCATGLKTKVLNTVIPVPEELHFAVIVPEVLVSTEYARSVLPNHIPFKEAVQNVSHASLFVTSLITHQLDNLSIALEDNLHVPYRKALIPHCDDVFMAAKTEGAYGATISGSGSTLIAYTDKCHVENVAKAMGEVFTSHGVENKIYCLEADTKGARII